jgi:hypothetical protein
MSELAAYLAGIFDGEGTLTFGTAFVLRACVANTNLEVLELLQKAYGGSIHVLLKHADRKQAYQWYLEAWEPVKLFLQGVRPYCIVKRRQVLFGLAYCETFDSQEKPLSQEIAGQRARLLAAIKIANEGRK